MSIKSWLFGLFQKTPEFDIHAPSVKSEMEKPKNNLSIEGITLETYPHKLQGQSFHNP